MAPTAPRTPAEHHYDVAESGLADLGRVGFDDAGRTVEVLVALTHATLAIAARLATNTDGVLP
jgi:ribosome-interacting GTPase 1